MTNPDLTQFTAIDEAPDAGIFVEFLDRVSALPSFVTLKSRMLRRLELKPGEQVLDVGCGTGADARRMVEHVVPGGQVTGIDASDAMLAVARARTTDLGLPVEYGISDAGALDFSDNSFDAVTIDRVLIHMEAGPERGLAEIHRVLRPGGRLVGFDVDCEQVLLCGVDPDLSRRVFEVAGDEFRTGRVPRLLPDLIPDAGFEVVEFTGHSLTMTGRWVFDALLATPLESGVASGRLSEEDTAAFTSALDAAEAKGRFLCSFPGFIFHARKPAGA